eukprot:gene9476-9556_t
MSESLTESQPADEIALPKQDAAEPAVSEPVAAPDQKDAPKPAKKSGFIGSLLVGSALGALIAAAVFVAAPMLVPMLPAQLSEHLRPPVSPATEARMAQIEARLASHDTALKSTSAIDSTLKALDARLKAVEARPATAASAAPAAAGLAPDLEARLAKLEAISTGPKSEARLPANPEAAPKVNNNLSLVVALDILNQRIAREMAFAAPLKLLENLGADPAKIAGLSPYAEKGLPTIRSLSESFAAIAPQLLPPEAPSQAGFFERLWLNAKKLVKIRSKLDPVSTDPAALVQRINSALALGKWQSVLDLVALLPSASQEKAKSFVTLVLARSEGHMMLRLVILLVVLAALAFGLGQLADQPGDISINWGNIHIEVSLLVGTIGLIAAVVALSIVWGLLRFVLRIPSLVSLASSARRRAKGYAAVSRGMVALGAGDQKIAQQASKDAEKHLKNEPLALLLKAQAAQMAGDRAKAEATFAQMAKHPDMRVLGLRGLHMEALRRGDADAAHTHASEASKYASVPWAAEAVLEHHIGQSDWTAALANIDRSVAARLLDKPTANRQRAVLKTAMAQDIQSSAPQDALKLVRDAVALSPNLIPAITLNAQLYARQSEPKKARKLIESSWPNVQHPDFVQIYLDLPGGDKAAERLKRAEYLLKLTPNAVDAILAVAKAAIATRDFTRAETVLAPLVQLDGPERPTNHACLAMADLEEARGNDGGAREWLARAARAPRDACWIADGMTSDSWSAVSPVTGKLDAFRWERPRENLAAFVYEAPVYPSEPAAEPVVPAALSAPSSPVAPAPIRRQPVIFPLTKAPDDPGLDDMSRVPKQYTSMLD